MVLVTEIENTGVELVVCSVLDTDVEVHVGHPSGEAH